MKISPTSTLPFNGNLSLISSRSLVIALMMTVLSSLGFFLPDLIYPDPSLAETFLTNDLVNILLALPLFIFSLVQIKHEKLLGFLLLPGALIYVIYNYTAYLLGRPLNWLSILNLGLLLLSIYTLVDFLIKVSREDVKIQLQGKVSENLSGWILVIFGAAFFLLASSQIISGILNGTIPPLGENAVSIADLVVSGCWMAGGILLLRRHSLGYTTGLGLLIAASFLFIGLILFFFLAPFLTARPFDWTEVFTVLVMGLICFVPAGLYWRGIPKSGD